MKKEEERYYLDLFAGGLPDLQLDNIRDFESPDFICTVSGISTGIEVTRFFFPSNGGVPPQAVDAYRNQLSRVLSEGHSNRGLPPAYISVHMLSDSKLINKRMRQQLAECLLDFVSAHMPSADSHVEFDYYNMDARLDELGVHRIAILRNAALTKPFWSLPHASFIPDSDSSLIQGIITEKSACAAGYRKNAAFVWLLIVSGSGGLHSIVDFDGDILSASYASEFDRIFLYRTFSSSVHELKKA